MIFEGVLGELEAKIFAGGNQSQNIWDWLWFWCDIVQYWKNLIFVFEEFFASIKKILILAGSLGPSLSFYEV